MKISLNIISGKGKYFCGFILLSFITVICLSMADHNDFETARREVLLRKIGHELLLQSGDGTSRVMPVKKISENEYQISFEKELTFRTDLLVNTTQRLLAGDPLVKDYVVNVINSNQPGVAYGFAISKNKKDDIIACKGRVQPKAPYLINIKFKTAGINIAKHEYLLGSLPFLAFVGFIFLRSAKPRKALVQNNQDTNTLNIGSALFDTQNRKLMANGQTIDLTGTETRLLLIFALSPNQTIARSQLQKEIWEDEGVIVGRSLDMFISKLRKKLEFDPNINIVVVRGKGYRLETNA
ncbi:transcriptional regulator [Pedobacter kyungheensis]|uniref:Transcriptional regulator n=1 Tax=Pedobacter kyungheensis TaxID=1069985 RepID=A0A0C1F9S8_9SPHI|nr:winged helix-turn-helix domain-containing protein [Pedobacter kyungheensis]KIA88623.1 transcriptional regulator [Pedobacter kyungheensis]